MAPLAYRQCQTDDVAVLKEAVWALANLASGGSALQARFTVGQGLFQGLASALPAFQGDPRMLKVRREKCASTHAARLWDASIGSGFSNTFRIPCIPCNLTWLQVLLECFTGVVRHPDDQDMIKSIFEQSGLLDQVSCWRSGHPAY